MVDTSYIEERKMFRRNLIIVKYYLGVTLALGFLLRLSF